jgi:hypothetical protein
MDSLADTRFFGHANAGDPCKSSLICRLTLTKPRQLDGELECCRLLAQAPFAVS